MMFLAAASLFPACSPGAVQVHGSKVQNTTAVGDTLATNLPAGWVEIDAAEEGFILDMPYAGTANFTRQQIYSCARCLLRPQAAEALRAANKQAHARGLKLIIYDAYRPLSYQQKMFDVVPDKRYVADPGKGSMHNRGCAVDVGLADSSGKALDMGTAFDDFSEKAAYAYPGLSIVQKQNRKILQELMLAAGFRPYAGEWWHFNYKKNDYPLSDYLWPCR